MSEEEKVDLDGNPHFDFSKVPDFFVPYLVQAVSDNIQIKRIAEAISENDPRDFGDAYESLSMEVKALMCVQILGNLDSVIALHGESSQKVRNHKMSLAWMLGIEK